MCTTVVEGFGGDVEQSNARMTLGFLEVSSYISTEGEDLVAQ